MVDTWTSQPAGVVPMTVEPLHAWEREGLSNLASPGLLGGGSMLKANTMLQEMTADPAAFAKKYMNPEAMGYLRNGADATSAAMTPITMQDVQGIANPFSSALKNRLTEQGNRARAAIIANQGMRGARSFGDTAQGVRQGMLDQEMLSKSSDIDFNTFESALQQLQQMRDRSLSAGGQFGNLATTAQGITSNANQTGLGGLSALFGAGSAMTQNGIDSIKNKIAAGNYVRTYNQGVNDLIGNDLLAEIADPAKKISTVLDWLRSFESGTAGATPKANSLQTAGGGLSAAGDLLSFFGNSGGSGTSSAINAAANGVRNAGNIKFSF